MDQVAGEHRRHHSGDVTEVNEALDDARLVISYAVRVGRLPDDALLKVVAAVRAASPDEAVKELPALVIALNSAVRSIAPMSLTQLRSGLSPFEPRGQRRLKRSQVFFSILTIILGALVATFTEQLRRQDLALRGFQQIQDSRFHDKLNTLRRKVQVDAILSQNDAVRFDDYHRSLAELRELQDKFNGAAQALSALAPAGWRDLLQPVTTILAKSGWLPQESPTSAVGTFRRDEKASTADTSTDACDPKAQEAFGSTKDYPDWVRLVIKDFLQGLCFETRLSVFVTITPQSVLWDIQNRMAELNAWILPFLYGLLGASVYVMRDMLDPSTPTLGFAAALLRISLGGIAGIIIGWFAAFTGSKPGESGGIALIPFSLAFVAGFSIDVLFAVLDRVQKMIRPEDRR